jgi:hypothetical protein
MVPKRIAVQRRAPLEGGTMKSDATKKSRRARLLVPAAIMAAGLAAPLLAAGPAQAAYFPLGDCTQAVYNSGGRSATYHHTDGNQRYYLIRNANGSLPNPGNWYDQANWASCFN